MDREQTYGKQKGKVSREGKDGTSDGALKWSSVCALDGSARGATVCASDGSFVGASHGSSVGALLGASNSASDGVSDGTIKSVSDVHLRQTSDERNRQHRQQGKRCISYLYD